MSSVNHLPHKYIYSSTHVQLQSTNALPINRDGYADPAHIFRILVSNTRHSDTLRLKKAHRSNHHMVTCMFVHLNNTACSASEYGGLLRHMSCQVRFVPCLLQLLHCPCKRRLCNGMDLSIRSFDSTKKLQKNSPSNRQGSKRFKFSHLQLTLRKCASLVKHDMRDRRKSFDALRSSREQNPPTTRRICPAPSAQHSATNAHLSPKRRPHTQKRHRRRRHGQPQRRQTIGTRTRKRAS